MSFLETQLSITGIKEFDTGNSYEKYDLINFQYYTGNPIYPTDASGLFAWFNLDDSNNLIYNVSGQVSSWINSAPGFKNQSLINEIEEKYPIFDIYEKKLVFKGSNSPFSYNQLYLSDITGVQTGTTGVDRCWFIVFSFDSLKNSNDVTPLGVYANFSTIIETDYNNSVASSGYLGIYGNNGNSSAQQFIINATGNITVDPIPEENNNYSVAKLVNRLNILTILKNNTSNNLTIRNNGYELYDSSSNFFHTGALDLQIGCSAKSHGSNSSFYNFDYSNISYYEILGYSKVPTEAEVLAIEKYLFQKNFKNEKNLYIAKRNFSSFDYRYSPLNLLGEEFADRNINSLFKKTYGCSASFSLKATKTNYGDGYYSNIISTVNNLIAEYDLIYQGLTDKQANSLIGFFQNSFENNPTNIYSSYENADVDLFFPYKQNAKVYFQSLDHQSPEPNINNITIKCRCPYDSSLDYKGVYVAGENTFITFDSSRVYNKHDVVYLNDYGYYWFTGADNTTLQNAGLYPTGSNSLFTQDFYFKPDANYSIALSPRYITNELETSSPVFEKDGINKNVLEFNLTFNNRSDKEALALLKYLDLKLGFQIFETVLPEPYNKELKVYCPQWQHSYKYKNCHDISVTFFEFKNPPVNDVYFNTIVQL